MELAFNIGFVKLPLTGKHPCAICRSSFTPKVFITRVLEHSGQPLQQEARKARVAVMRHDGRDRRSRGRRRGVPPRRERRTVFSEESARLTDVVRTVRSVWRQTPLGHRLLVSIAVLVVLPLTAAAANVFMHALAALTFTAASLVMAPALLVLAASVAAFAMVASTAAAAGAGIFITGTPLFVIAIAAKAVLPLFAMAAVALSVLKTVTRRTERLFRGPVYEKRENITTVEGREVADKKYDDGGKDWRGTHPPRLRDELDEFDRLLRRRTSKRRDDVVENWSLTDVVDELDACGLGQYRQLFIDERIDGHTLLSLTDADIRTEFAHTMPLGDRRRLSRLVTSLQRETKPPSW